jgi:rod shape-determining protein MreC
MKAGIHVLMKKLFYFLYTYRACIVFILLACIGVSLSVKHRLHETFFYDTVGSVQNFIEEAKNYSFLKAENTKLLQENATLREELSQVEAPESHLRNVAPCHFMPAQVINNSIVGTKNYLTLNKGSIHGIGSGMGVVSAEGIVGRIQAVSDRFATVTSLLHTAVRVSAKISHSHALGTVQWSGKDPCRVQMLYVPRHVLVVPGDLVVTSGYNATFSEGVVIGHIQQVNLRQEASFYDIEIHLSTDFSTLQHVYVVKNTLKEERDDLEQRSREFYE